MLVKEFIFLVLVTFASARHYIPADLKPGTFGFMIDGKVIKTWTPDEFDEWRSTNPLVELLLVAGYGYPYLKPGTQGNSNAGTSLLGPTSVSQASSSVGNGGSFASAGVVPVGSSSSGVLDGLLSTTHLPLSTAAKLELSTEPSDPPTPTETSTSIITEDKVVPDDDASTSSDLSTTQTSVNSDKKTQKPLTESSFLDIDVTTKSNKDGEKPDVSEKDNEIDQEISAGDGLSSKDPSSSTAIKTASGDASTNSGRPAVSRPGFSSATSAASASAQVHAEGTSLAESPGSTSKGTSESNSNSASVVYGEFAGSVSISSSSSTG